MLRFPSHCLYHPPTPQLRSASALLLLILCLASLLSGCSESTGPTTSTSPQGGAHIEGNLDPGDGTFVLETQADPMPDGREGVPVELIGSNLRVNAAEEVVAIDVAIRNITPRLLYAPASVLLNDFVPPDVSVLNADFVCLPADSVDPNVWFPYPCGYGFDYSELLGGDGVLEPDEVSEVKTWEFQVPGLGGFSFNAWATFGLFPDLPLIAGFGFEDLNANGVPEPGEPHNIRGEVTMQTPSGLFVFTMLGEDGAYAFPVEESGLYTLTLFPHLPPHHPHHSPPVFTTPNPLQVLLPPDENGLPVSFLEAHFGLNWEGTWPPGPPPVILVDVLPDPQHPAPYDLLEIVLRGDILMLEVGFSGCQPAHPFDLFMVGAFMESLPVRANLVLMHDDLGEMCDRYMMRELLFHLGPIREAYLEAYGEPGTVILMLRDFNGDVHEIEYEFGPWSDQ